MHYVQVPRSPEDDTELLKLLDAVSVALIACDVVSDYVLIPVVVVVCLSSCLCFFVVVAVISWYWCWSWWCCWWWWFL